MSFEGLPARRPVWARASICALAVLLGTLAAAVPGQRAGAAGESFVTQKTLEASDRAVSDSFGSAVAISDDGDTAVVGAPNRNSFKGGAYVFTRSGQTWSQEGSALTVSGAHMLDSLGATIALSGDGTTALLGAPSRNSYAGGVYVFVLSGGTWSQQGSILTGSDETGGDLFGRSLALSGDGGTALIGASGAGGSAGAAYVFTRSGSSWSQQAGPLTPTGGAANDAFGTAAALSLDGDTALVGADARSSNRGAGYVYTRSGSTWSQQGSALVASNATANDQLGISAALSADGDTALLGAYGRGGNRGAAFVFTRSGAAWSQQGSALSPPAGSDPAGNAEFGVSVDLTADGDTAMIGAFGRSTNRGAVYAFTRSSNTWSQQGWAITPPGVQGNDQFGISVSTSSDASTVLVGENGVDGYTGAAAVLGRAASIPTGIALAANHVPAAVGQEITYTATVSPMPDGGTVAFSDGASAIPGCESVDVNLNNGNSTCKVTYANPGSHSIVATFSGHDPFDGSASDPLSEPVLAPTTTTLESNHNPADVDQPVTYTATVNPAPSGGTMGFADGGTAIAGCTSKTVNPSTGRATCQVSYPEGGTHSIVATYSGSGPYQTSSSAPFGQTVRKVTTTTSLTSSRNPSIAGQLVSFTATVAPTPDGGTVAFADHGSPVDGCESVSLSGSRAVCPVAFAPGAAGGHALVASYQGDARYTDSRSGNVAQTVRLALKGLRPSKNAKLKVGKQVSVTFQLSDASGKAIPDGAGAKLGRSCAGKVTLGKLRNKCAKYERAHHRFAFSTKLPKKAKTGATKLSVRVEVGKVLVASASEPVRIVR
jgi:Bacterial Ig-like domain (group 3)/FG-GAP repeat